MSSNIAVLTQSHKIIASKKRAKRDQIKEVVFDDDARRDFLTGFHKRKVQKKEAAKKKAQDREKQERVEARREQRQMLAERAAQNAEHVEKAYRNAIAGEDSEGDDETVFSASENKGKGKAALSDEEYEDEEQLATVTVIEDFDPETIIHGTSESQACQSDNAGPVSTTAASHEGGNARSKPINQFTVAVKKTRAKTTSRAKDIKYQTKAERKTERTKQRRRKLEKSELAGGKLSRKKPHGRGKR